MAGERIDYTAAAVEAARSVLIELTHILGEWRSSTKHWTRRSTPSASGTHSRK
ncbi:MAG: hypothetical protein WCT12_33960 [Verrucomicrobiota bacterium]